MKESILFGVHNLIKLCKKYTGFVALFLTSIYISLIALYFSYGVYTNYIYESNDGIYGSRSIQIGFTYLQEDKKETAATFGSIKSVIWDIEDELGGFYDSVLISAWDPYSKAEVNSVIEYRKAEYSFLDQSGRELIETGRYFSQDEIDSGARVCLTYWDDRRDIFLFGERYIAIGKFRNWYGGDYEDVINSGTNDIYYVPFNSMPENANVNRVEFHMGKMVSERIENTVKEGFESFFGDAFTYLGPDEVQETGKEASETLVIIAVLLAILASINLYVIMDYMFRRRKKLLALVRICGGGRGSIMLGQMVESCILIFIGMTAAYMSYALVFQKFLQTQFVYFNDIYTLKAYAELTQVYLVVVVLFIMVLNAIIALKTPLHIWRE